MFCILKVTIINEKGGEGKAVLPVDICKINGLLAPRVSVTIFIFQLTDLSLLCSFTEVKWSVSCLVVLDSVTPRTAAHQAPLSRWFSRQGYWSGLPFPSPGDLPDWGIEPRSPALQADSLLTEEGSLSQSFSQFPVVFDDPLSNVHATTSSNSQCSNFIHYSPSNLFLTYLWVETVLFSQRSSLTLSLSVIFGTAPSSHPFLSLLLLSSHLPRSIYLD